jgi:hypothetical protein
MMRREQHDRHHDERHEDRPDRNRHEEPARLLQATLDADHAP